MTQQEMSDAFNVFGCDTRRAIRAIYKNMELLESDTMRYVRQGNGICYDVYSLEMVIAIATLDLVVHTNNQTALCVRLRSTGLTMRITSSGL